MKSKLLKEIQSEIQSCEDLPEPYRTIAELIGIENTLTLAETLGGDSLYLPRLTSVMRIVRNRQIQKQFTGYNTRSLARKHKISVRRVQQLIMEAKPKAKSKKSLKSDYCQLSIQGLDT